MAQSTVILPKSFMDLDKNLVKAVGQGIEECTDDLLRVASLRTPVDTGNLEKAGTSKVIKSGKSIKGFVSFSAVNRGFNYAKKLNDSTYNLGSKSIRKSSRGVRSKFTKASLKVGTGYLTGTALECQEGYSEHINKLIGYEISKKGFK